jgi:hypothetical protein
MLAQWFSQWLLNILLTFMLTLYVDTPFLRVQTKGLEGTLLTESLGLVDELVSAVVTCSGISFRVLVWKGNKC